MNISEDAIEAAAKVFERSTGVRDTLTVENILEAAAPHMQAEAWEECLESDTPWINPYGTTR